MIHEHIASDWPALITWNMVNAFCRSRTKNYNFIDTRKLDNYEFRKRWNRFIACQKRRTPFNPLKDLVELSHVLCCVSHFDGLIGIWFAQDYMDVFVRKYSFFLSFFFTLAQESDELFFFCCRLLAFRGNEEKKMLLTVENTECEWCGEYFGVQTNHHSAKIMMSLWSTQWHVQLNSDYCLMSYEYKKCPSS